MRSLAALCATLVACYEPDAVDCTIACSAADECAEGQICGSDGMCAAPEVAGRCKDDETEETAEPSSVALVIKIAGKGKINVEGIGSCDSEGPSDGTCMFSVPAGVMRQLKAIENGDREFISWTQTCAGTSSTCALTPVIALTNVGAKFE